MCTNGSHAYVAQGAVIYCTRCGDVRSLTFPAVEQRPFEWKTVNDPVTIQQPSVPPPDPLDDQTVQELEAEVIQRMRDAGLKPGEAFNRAGIALDTPFAQRVMEQMQGQLDLFPSHGTVADLSDDERSLLDRSNAHEQRRVIVDGKDTLEADL